MKTDRRIVACMIYAVLGITLLCLGIAEMVDAFWSGMGGALIAVGVIRLIHIVRYSKDESYRETKEIEAKDERNQFIRNKAWAWAAYIFVLIAAISTIVFQLLGQELLSMAAGFSICLIMILYWLCHLILIKKY